MANLQLTPGPGSPGVFEHGLARHTGLRLGTISGILSSSSGQCITASAAGANSVDWQTLAINKGNRLPIPCTPAISVWFLPTGINLMTAYVTTTWSFRVTGFDQFDRPIQETLPDVIVAKHANTVDTATFTFWMSKVFSVITKIELKASNGTMAAVATYNVGAKFTWDAAKVQTADAELNFGGAGGGKDEELLIYSKNQGIGLPLPINAALLRDPYTLPDIKSFMVELASAVAAETNYGMIRPYVGGAGGGGFILGQYRGAADTINSQTVSYANVVGDPNKIRIERNATDTILAMDNTTGMTFYTGGATAAITPNIMRYTLNVYSSVGAKVGGRTGHTSIPG